MDPSAIGHLVDVTTTLEQVRVSRAGRLLADHERSLAARQTLTDPAHVQAATALRQRFQAGPPPVVGDHLIRDLSDYDRAFGVDLSTGPVTSNGEMARSWPRPDEGRAALRPGPQGATYPGFRGPVRTMLPQL